MILWFSLDILVVSFAYCTICLKLSTPNHIISPLITGLQFHVYLYVYLYNVRLIASTSKNWMSTSTMLASYHQPSKIGANCRGTFESIEKTLCRTIIKCIFFTIAIEFVELWNQN
jgi:hypothetical protein